MNETETDNGMSWHKIRMVGSAALLILISYRMGLQQARAEKSVSEYATMTAQYQRNASQYAELLAQYSRIGAQCSELRAQYSTLKAQYDRIEKTPKNDRD
jgi:hypothetical protein